MPCDLRRQKQNSGEEWTQNQSIFPKDQDLRVAHVEKEGTGKRREGGLGFDGKVLGFGGSLPQVR